MVVLALTAYQSGPPKTLNHFLSLNNVKRMLFRGVSEAPKDKPENKSVLMLSKSSERKKVVTVVKDRNDGTI